MKKILIATTALVAFAGAANAAEPIKLTVGGFAEQWVGYADQDLPNGAERNKFDVQGDTEIHFKGSTKLDNGITVAVTVEAEAGQNQRSNAAIVANGSASSIDESYITVSGGFGALIVGQQDNVGEIIHNASPDVGIGNQDGDFMNWIEAPAGGLFTTYADNDGDADKVIYVTPAFYGIQAGVSYTPDTDAARQGDQGLPTTADTNDLWVGGFAYSGKFGGVTVKADVGAGQWNIEAGDNITVYQGGLNVGYAGFTLGGSYLKRDIDVAAGSDDLGNAWDIGVSYETGPYAASLTYFDSTTGDAGGELETTSVMLSGAYTMGPGVAAKASLFKVDYEAPGTANDNDGWGFVTGLRLDF